MPGIFLDAGILREKELNRAVRFNVQQNRIQFEFPEGFAQLRLIEECRALNALDVSDGDNFDLMYDITMQMLTGKTCVVYFLDDDEKRHEAARFHVTDRYMNMRGVDIIDEYPVLINWLVEEIAEFLSKKFPRSLESIQAALSARGEPAMKK